MTLAQITKELEKQTKLVYQLKQFAKMVIANQGNPDGIKAVIDVMKPQELIDKLEELS